jgi:hypothetical protein
VDFIEDKLVSGRRLRILSVLDLCSRYALDSLVEHSLTGELAARHLERLFLSHGAPRVLRRDQGPEFESRVFQKLLRTWRVQDEPVPKGQHFDNGHVESFHGSLRDELLDAELFHSLGEAQAKVATWLHRYNSERPHQGLGTALPVSVGRQPPLRGLRLTMDLRPLRGGWGCQAMQDNLNPLIKRVSLLGTSQTFRPNREARMIPLNKERYRHCRQVSGRASVRPGNIEVMHIEKPAGRGENLGATGLTEWKKEHNLSAPQLAPTMHTCRPYFLLIS